MPIKTLERQQPQAGRIRIGQQLPVGKTGTTRPGRLESFRFTSPAKALLDAVAAVYGGTVSRWEPRGRPAEWELYTDATTLQVLVPPQPVSQYYELWDGKGCLRRCDGEINQLTGAPCECPADVEERVELAAEGRACKATTRLKVMLPDVPGMGVWRLDTHGYYAAVELPGTAEFLGSVTEGGAYVPATLSLEARQVQRRTGVRRFLVPVLHVDATPQQLAAGEGLMLTEAVRRQVGPAAAPALTAAAPPTADDLAEQLADRLGMSSYEECQQIYREAREANLLEVMIADHEDVMEELGQLIIARARTLAPPADEPDRDPDTGEAIPAGALQ